MSDRVAVVPQLLSWARDRAGLTHSALEKRFPRLRQWESGDLQPTMLQLEEGLLTIWLTRRFQAASVAADPW